MIVLADGPSATLQTPKNTPHPFSHSLTHSLILSDRRSEIAQPKQMCRAPHTVHVTDWLPQYSSRHDRQPSQQVQQIAAAQPDNTLLQS